MSPGSLWTLSGRGWLAAFAVAILLLGVWIGIDATQPTSASTAPRTGGQPSTSASQASPHTSPAPTRDPGQPDLIVAEPPLLGKSADQVLALLHIRRADSAADYQRTQDFGPAWMDVDGNGCDTRDDILQRDLKGTSLNGCKVMSGTFVDPYTGQSMSFMRGNDTSTLVQIDHIVALLNAWSTGAQELTQEQRERLANDPTNLLAVSEQTNQDKGADDAAKWLPPFSAFHCEYAARQISVKFAYGLWVTQPEHDALASALQSCPNQPAYRSSLSVALTVRTPAPVASPTAALGFVGGGTTVYYANCSAAYAVGASHIRRGAPGYRAELDRDQDGIACEG